MTRVRFLRPFSGLALFALAVGSSAHAEPVGRPAPDLRYSQPADSPPLGLRASMRLHASLVGATGFPTDSDGTEYALDPTLDTQVRLRAEYQYAWDGGRLPLALTFEEDLASGVVSGGPAAFDGVDAPYGRDADDFTLRIASIRFSFGNVLTLAAGAMTSHWGLGLVANDGAHGGGPGSGRFSDPRGGDRVLRAMLMTGPHTDSELRIFAAVDSVLGDDVLVGDDQAWQAVFGVLAGPNDRMGGAWTAGLYGVYREQEAGDGDRTKVGVIDVYGRLEDASPTLTLRAELEAALIVGTTELAPTADHPSHDVLQLGAAARLTAEWCLGGVGLDLLYASGDPDFDDDTQSGFKADRNFDLGMLLNDVVLAARTSRTPLRASDPELVGVPAEDLDRLPTRGSATNTVSLFPHAWVRPVDGLEIYGGLLLALSATSESDAFNARLAGGQPENALGGDPGTLLATELDAGVRVSGLMWMTRLVLALEGGVVFPGSGLTGPAGLGEDPIWGGRVLATWEL